MLNYLDRNEAHIRHRPTPPLRLHVLVVDADKAVGRSITSLLKRLRVGYTLATPEGAAITLLSTGGFDLLLTDLQMPQMNGIELLERVHSKQPGLSNSFLTGALTDYIGRAAKSAAGDLLTKPFAPAESAPSSEGIFFKSAVLPQFAQT